MHLRRFCFAALSSELRGFLLKLPAQAAMELSSWAAWEMGFGPACVPEPRAQDSA